MSGHVTAALVAIGVVWVLTAINLAGVRQTGIVQVVTTVLKFVPLALIGIVGLFFIKAANFGAFRIGNWGDMFSGITAAATLTLWAFIGLESATVPAEEVKDPKRTIVRSTIWGTLATTCVYALATIAIVGIIRPRRSRTPTRRSRRPPRRCSAADRSSACRGPSGSRWSR